MCDIDLEKSGSREDGKTKTLTYRVRGIPSGLDKAGAQSLLQAALGTRDLIIDSLAAATSKQVATVRLPGRPAKLDGCKRQWQVSARGITMTVDKHFGGFTPLHDPETNAEPTFDCVVISGLGSHAFGSWKDRHSDHMWIRDALPEQLPGARVMLYGYDSTLANSTSSQNLGDVASRFRESLLVNIGKRTNCRPLIFIAHSLGGLVLKQAIIQMASGNSADLENLRATFAIFFFGVPNQGMDIKSLYAMVRGQVNIQLLAACDKNSSHLQELASRFQAVFDFRDSHVVSFFETDESPTAKLNEGRWSMTGDPTILVDRYSAKSGRSWEDKLSHIHPINCTHSEMVKFPEHDENCEVVLGKLKRVSELAPAVIRARCGNDTPARTLVIRKRREINVTAPNPMQKHLMSLGTSITSEPKTNDPTPIQKHLMDLGTPAISEPQTNAPNPIQKHIMDLGTPSISKPKTDAPSPFGYLMDLPKTNAPSPFEYLMDSAMPPPSEPKTKRKIRISRQGDSQN